MNRKAPRRRQASGWLGGHARTVSEKNGNYLIRAQHFAGIFVCAQFFFIMYAAEMKMGKAEKWFVQRSLACHLNEAVFWAASDGALAHSAPLSPSLCLSLSFYCQRLVFNSIFFLSFLMCVSIGIVSIAMQQSCVFLIEIIIAFSLFTFFW